MRGAFLTFEGTEGTGKSTQARMLVEALASRGVPVLMTREPGGTVFGSRLRGMLLATGGDALDPYAELFLYLADRTQHVREVVVPALGRGTWVVCDRFADATAAYQGSGRGLDLELIREANARATGGLAPDLTFLLDLERVEVGLARARRRQQADGTAGREDRFEREAVAFHRAVRAGYLRLAGAEPVRFRVLDAESAPEQLHRAVLEAVLERFPALAAAGPAP